MAAWVGICKATGEGGCTRTRKVASGKAEITAHFLHHNIPCNSKTVEIQL